MTRQQRTDEMMEHPFVLINMQASQMTQRTSESINIDGMKDETSLACYLFWQNSGKHESLRER